MSKRRAKQAVRQDGLAGKACEQYHAELHRYLVRRLRSSHTAHDLAQEAYLRLLRVERSELVRQPRAYLYRIATNLIYEFRLKEQREPITFDSVALEEAAERASDSTEEQGEQLAEAQQLEAILGQLPPLYRAIFVLRKRDGLSYPEIAQQLEISVHTVKKYLARAVAMCRSASWQE